MNIVLIGTIGAGKSTIGRAISEMSAFKFVDTDDLIHERMASELDGIGLALNLFYILRFFIARKVKC